ncbi:DUF202 domain-containing protein [Ligilactobacillus ruminis]|jgi:hypothetical protein|uniref:DUF202 domain-containing protein n=1 Tax=Ligilactobacillus ruminis TaxID=1623 RepID=A0A8B2Z9M5_9LACO|nr:DUF202 domain-containing protein [Ligilactobacillus ruminis]RGK48472.1 DUF202 domain-containing protein [Ligilactobacillus ruminis]
MTKEQLEQGYLKEIEYQKHMLENLSRWMNLWFMLVGIGVVLIYSLRTETFFLVCGIVAVSVGILGMLVFGCGIYHGNKNLKLVIEDFEEKVTKTA